MRKNSVEITVSLKDVVTKGLKSVQSSLSSFRKNVLNLKTAIAGVGLGMLATDAVKTASSFEQLETKLDALTKGKGKETLTEINEWALDMPVNTQKAVDAFTMMQAMGLDPTIEKMETLVDASTVFGEDTMPRVARALGQMQTLGKLSAEELNQMAEAGINARKYLAEAFGMTVEEIQKSEIAIEDVVQAIWDGLDRDFGGAAASAQTKWQAMVSTMMSYWTEFQRLVMESGLFNYIKAVFKTLLDRVQELKNNGQLQEWARSVSDAVIDSFERMLLGVAGFVDAVRPMIDRIGSVAGDLYDGFKKLPGWIQEVGILAAIVGGKKGAAVLAALSSVAGEISVQAAGLRAARAGLIGWGDIVFSTNSELKELLKNKGLLEKSEDGSTSAKGPIVAPGSNGRYAVIRPDESATDPESATHAAQTWIAKFRETLANAAPAVQKTTKDVMSSVQQAAVQTLGKVSLSSLAQAELTKFQALQQTRATELEKALDGNAVSLAEYYDRKKAMAEESSEAEIEAIRAKYGAEIQAIEDQLEHESDLAVAKKLRNSLAEKELELTTELYVKEQALARDLLDIETKRAEALEKNNQVKSDLLSDLKERAEGEQSTEDRFAGELEALASKHEKELSLMEEHGASKKELLEAQALQEQEIENRKAEHQKAIYDQRITWAKDFVGGMADSMQALYASGLAQSESMFQVYKAFAIAQAVIATYESAQKAYNSMASIPYVGPALGAAAAGVAIASGMARVAAIKSSQPKGYAYGGLIGGPDEGNRADNVTIRATPGEYMMDRPTVRHYGVRVMEALRQRLIPRDLLSGVQLPVMRPAYAGPGFAYGGQIGRQNTPSPAPQQTTIVNLTDKSELDRYLASVEGQNAIMNIISTRSQTVRRIVGD
jgi:tape measure domain-containing protein